MLQLPLTSSVETFITRWETAGATERPHCQLLLTAECEPLGLPQPEPLREATQDNA